MKGYQDLIYELHGHQQFDFLLKDLIQHRPHIPSYDPSLDNTEDWKFKTAQQAGYDLCLSILNINPEK